MEKETVFLPDEIQAELDRRLFHFRTLYDVSRELFGLIEVGAILRNFLLNTMGNFGTFQGFIMTQDSGSKEPHHFRAIGFPESQHATLQELGDRLIKNHDPAGVTLLEDVSVDVGPLKEDLGCFLSFKVDEQCSGAIGLGPKLVGHGYKKDDKELLETLVNNLAVSLKNARSSEALRNAYEEIKILNSAKDKVISHLSHELTTPIALLGGCLSQLQKRLAQVPEESWQRTMDRAKRGLQRLSEIQSEVQDIMRGKEVKAYQLMSRLLDQCANEIEQLVAEKSGEGPVVEEIRRRIDELFAPRRSEKGEILLDKFVAEKLEEMKPLYAHRQIDLVLNTSPTPPIPMAPDALEKTIRGLVRNAIENTPDEGKIEVFAGSTGNTAEFAVRDYGVGILPENQTRIFEGFFPTQDTMLYVSGKPFEFGAGGRGADLLRMKIFSERFNFKVTMTSSRCKYIPQATDVCPGRISLCEHCKGTEDCYHSGGTTFEVRFAL